MDCPAVEEARLHALINDLRNLLDETPWAEFKTSLNDPDRIGRLISAISNGARLHDKTQGYLMWGIDDATHAVIGTEFDQNKKHKGQPFEFWMAGQIAPSLHMVYHTTIMNGHKITLLVSDRKLR